MNTHTSRRHRRAVCLTGSTGHALARIMDTEQRWTDPLAGFCTWIGRPGDRSRCKNAPAADSAQRAAATRSATGLRRKTSGMRRTIEGEPTSSTAPVRSAVRKSRRPNHT